MEVKAQAKFIRMSPRKVRLVASLIRAKTVAKANDQLRFVNKAAGLPVMKLLASAVANAKHNFEMSEDNLLIKEIKVDGGPTLHRWTPKAHGRATPIRKRTSHITIILGEIKDTGIKEARKAVVEAPVKLSSKSTEDDGVKIEDKKDLGKHDRSDDKKSGAKADGGKGFTNRLFNRKSG